MKLLIYVELFLTVTVCSCVGHLLANDANSLRCSANVDTPGTTFPKGDIILEVGSNLTIYCILNETHPLAVNRNASHLLFYNRTERVSMDHITILNETTIQLHMTDVKKSKSMFYCKLRDSSNSEKGVCLNTVMIDTKPQPVTDFSCVSYNWQNLSCTWKNPLYYVRTKYDLKFRLGGPGASKKMYISCPKKTATDESCLWDLTTDPMYKQQDKEYFFYIHGYNQFGHWYQKDIQFHHFQRVLPSPPVNLKVLNKTAHSVTISWEPMLPMQVFPGGLVHKVEYQSMYKNVWEQVDTSMLPERLEGPKVFTITINNLSYANTLYDIRVCMKSAKAQAGEQLWSLPSNITFRTLPTEPDYPPKTDVGSFQIEKGKLGKRNVYIYWQQLPEYHNNGANFSYVVTLVNPNTNLEVPLKPSEQSKTYAKFNDLEDMEYTFKIYSTNSEGRSSSSEVTVPQKNHLLPEPISFTKIAYEKQTYELSWIPPKMAEFSFVDYTLFWCANDRDRPYQCTGFLNWIHIPGDSIAQNITVPDDKIYQFAISMNMGSTSSGMVWSLCTVIHNRFSSKMNNVYIRHVGSSSIVVAWQLECSDRVGVIKGFIVRYCPVWSISTECGEKELSLETNDSTATELNVTGLRSYTVYKLSVAVLTTDGPGEPSEPVYNTTYASAPSRPPEIKSVQDITNTSANVTWQKPSVAERNGNIVEYQICFNSTNSNTICITDPEKFGSSQSAVINNLDAFTIYTVKIRAFTNAWSANSTGIEFLTHIGNPEKMSQPRAEFVNATATHIIWDPPKKPNGPLQGYQIKINYFNGKSQHLNEVCSNRNETCSALVVLTQPLKCEDHRPNVQIRAYNVIVDENGEHIKIYGPWSDSDYLMCTNYAVGLQGTILFALLLSMFLLPLIYYLGKKMYEMFKKSSELAVKLPPGLDIDTKDTKSHFTSQPWIPADYNDIKPPLPADEEYLIRPTRTPNRSESENDSEQVSLGSGDTQSSECHQASSTSAGSELEVNSTASTPPMQAYKAHNVKSNAEKSAAALLSKMSMTMSEQPEVKPNESNLSYVIIGTNNAIIPKPSSTSPTVEDQDSSLEEEDDSLGTNFLPHLDRGMLTPAQLLNEKLLSELTYPPAPEQGNYHKYGESCLPMFQKPTYPQAEDNRVSSMKNLVISTKPNTPTSVTTTTCTSGYQPLPLTSSKPIEQKPTSPVLPPVSAIVINKGSSGYVTVSNASVEPHNCV